MTYTVHIEHIGIHASTQRHLTRIDAAAEVETNIEMLLQRAFANGAASVRITIERESEK